MDYGRPLSFGYFPSPDAAGLTQLLATIRLAVQDGIDSFVFGPAREPERQLRLWAEEVAPAVRANVSSARAV